MINGTELKLCGMSRSGNHAIVNWIWAQAKGPKVLLNCAEGKTNPFETCRPLDETTPWLADFDVDMERERRAVHRPKEYLIHTYEDSFLGHAFAPWAEENTFRWIGRSARRVGLIVLRDPYNLFASRRKAGMALPARTAVMMWKQHARAALGLKKHPIPDKTVVVYNHWVTDAEYRADLAAKLGLDFTDDGHEAVSPCHGGSSFDGVDFDGHASDMDLFGRWKLYAEDPAFRALFDTDLVALSRRLFGPQEAEEIMGLEPPRAEAAE